MEAIQENIKFIKDKLTEQSNRSQRIEDKLDAHILLINTRFEGVASDLAEHESEIKLIKDRQSTANVLQTVLASVLTTVGTAIAIFWKKT